MVCQSQLYSKVTQFYTYIYFFTLKISVFLKIFFSVMVYPRRLDIVPCAIQKNLVVSPF